ncbi:MAG TPA: glycosyltransferase family 4 protein [Lacipirellulaceae bacterium]|nr:glycosyltransferase family 4 protein [Lacipirellulaceae bacterium]
MSRSTEDQPNQITFIGALPPPVTGMTAMSQVIVEELKKGGPVRCFNWSAGRHLSGMRWKLVRVFGALRSFVRILFGRRPPRGVVYYPLSSGWGLFYDIAILAGARLRGYRLVLHHHVYSYIDRRDWRMALLLRVVGPSGIHVVHCEQMKNDFLAQYAIGSEFLFVPPTIVAQHLESAPRTRRERFTLGFMSNLTFAKGLDSALKTYDQLAREGRNVALVLAGPCHGAAERRVLDEFLAKWPNGVEYRGPVYDAAKGRFFADIDVFLFPTRYAKESWGIVLTEALSANCPVISCRRGCVPWIVQDGCGIVIGDPSEFPHHASQAIVNWMDDEQEFERAQQRAGERARLLSEEADRQFATFLQRLREI